MNWIPPLTLPEPLLDYASVSRALQPIGMVLVTCGLISAVVVQKSGEAFLSALLRATVIIALIANFDSLINFAQNGVEALNTEVLHARPADVADKYITALEKATSEQTSDDASLFGNLWLVPNAVFELGLVVIVVITALVGAILFFLAYVLQRVFLEMGFALAPIFLGLLMITSVRSIGLQYLLGMAGIVLWPLGWAVASLVTDRLIDYTANQAFMVASPESMAFALRNLLASLMLAVWVIVTTIAAPVVIQRALAQGVQVGSGLIIGPAAMILRRFL